MPVLIPPEKVAEILTSADIFEIVSETIELKKAGKDFVGLCPFHSEKTPSFTVSPTKQIFHCFGCHEGGNVFSFIMRREGMTFVEAARHLAARYGVSLPSPSAGHDHPSSQKDRLVEINGRALAYFRSCLADRRAGGRAMDYLARRGISAQTIERFQLGFAPDAWEGLVTSFKKQNISSDLLVKAGLVVARDGQKGHYDRFRDRVIFPIWDHRGQVIAFGGRILGEGQPKYLNSPETPLFQKKRTLYGFHLARQACRSLKRVFIVEGYMDLVALHQAGIQNTVATLGTALSAEQVRLLRGLMGDQAEAILVFDGDAAGVSAARRSIAIFNQNHLPARILVLPEGHDPDSFVREKGREAFARVADKANTMIGFLLDDSIGRHGLTVDGKISVVNEMATVLSQLHDPLAFGLYTKEVAERLGIAEDAVLAKVGRSGGGQQGPSPHSRAPQRRDERQIVAMLLQFPELAKQVAHLAVDQVLEDAHLKKIAGTLLRGSTVGEHVGSLVQDVVDPEDMKLVTALALDHQEVDAGICLDAIKRFVEKRRQRIEVAKRVERIRHAEKNEDDALWQELAQMDKAAKSARRKKKTVTTGP